MSNNYRVLNLTTGERTKYKQALKRIEECLWAWVEEGKTARSLTLQEQMSARAERNREIVPTSLPSPNPLSLNGHKRLIWRIPQSTADKTDAYQKIAYANSYAAQYPA